MVFESPVAHPLGLPLLLILHDLAASSILNRNEKRESVNDTSNVNRLDYLTQTLNWKAALKNAAATFTTIHAELDSQQLELFSNTTVSGKASGSISAAMAETCSAQLYRAFAASPSMSLFGVSMQQHTRLPIIYDSIYCDGTQFCILLQKGTASGTTTDCWHESKRAADLGIVATTADTGATASAIQNHGHGEEFDKSNNDIVALLAFDRDHDEWLPTLLEKVRLHLKTNQSSSRCQEQPLLVIAVAVAQVNDQGKSQCFRIAAFLCWQKSGTKRQCLALLWRTVTSDNASTQRALALVVAAAASCLGDWQTIDIPNEVYQVLGPNCCQTKYNGIDVVLRSYDTRWHATEQKPTMYYTADFMNAIATESRCFVTATVNEKYAEQKNKTKEGRVVIRMSNDELKAQATVLHLCDAHGPLLEFGQLQVENQDVSCNHLWDMKGQYLVIQVPYIGGTVEDGPSDDGTVDGTRHPHTAGCSLHFIPIVKQLQALHKLGFVHGDIRSFNMLLGIRNNDNSNVMSTLIDFDLSGQCGQARYPKNYAWALPDGKRRFGRGGELIEQRDDWYALAHVILYHHHFHPTHSDDTTKETRLEMFEDADVTTREAQIEGFELLHEFMRPSSSEDSAIDPLVRRLLALLECMASWECKIGQDLQFAFKRARFSSS